MVVLSGLAAGIDSAAHEGALAPDRPAPPVAVVGGGVDVVYPGQQQPALGPPARRRGASSRRRRPGRAPEGWRFPLRNRLIAALAHVVVVVESHKPRRGVAHRGGRGRARRDACWRCRDRCEAPPPKAPTRSSQTVAASPVTPADVHRRPGARLRRARQCALRAAPAPTRAAPAPATTRPGRRPAICRRALGARRAGGRRRSPSSSFAAAPAWRSQRWPWRSSAWKRWPSPPDPGPDGSARGAALAARPSAAATATLNVRRRRPVAGRAGAERWRKLRPTPARAGRRSRARAPPRRRRSCSCHAPC